MSEDRQDRRGIIRAEQAIAEIYLARGLAREAVPLARNAQQLAEQSEVKELIYITAHTLARVLAETGAYREAYQYQTRYADIKDSVRNRATQNRLDFIESEKKQQEILMLRQQQQFKDQQARIQRRLNYGLIAALGLAILLIFTFYQKQRLQRKANRLLQEKNAEINQQKEEISDQAEQLRELNFVKDRLFSIISHDLRSPLRNLTELLQLTQEGSLPSEQLKAFLPQLTNHVDQTTELLDGLLVWAENQLDGERLAPEPIQLRELVARKVALINLQSKPKNVCIYNEVDADLMAFADLRMTEIVIQNLLSNAVKFCEQGDHVSVYSRLRPDGMAEVSVKDTGVGIDTENLPRLFGRDVFTTRGTRDERGSGLGLMLCREFVARNGGQIHVESQKGVGSTFSFTLPTSQATSSAPHASHPLEGHSS
jgi:two-component system, sensor histidine kinase and response regulator